MERNRPRCHLCKEYEGTNHDRRCPYYWALLAVNKALAVDAVECIVEYEDGCPLRALDGTECVGCAECDFDIDVK